MRLTCCLLTVCFLMFSVKDAEAIGQAGSLNEAGMDKAYKEQQTEDSGRVPLRIISMNDLHGKIDQQYELDLNGDGKPDGTFGRMDYAAYIKKAKAEKEHAFVVHAGDMIGGALPCQPFFRMNRQ